MFVKLKRKDCNLDWIWVLVCRYSPLIPRPLEVIIQGGVEAGRRSPVQMGVEKCLCETGFIAQRPHMYEIQKIRGWSCIDDPGNNEEASASAKVNLWVSHPAHLAARINWLRGRTKEAFPWFQLKMSPAGTGQEDFLISTYEPGLYKYIQKQSVLNQCLLQVYQRNDILVCLVRIVPCFEALDWFNLCRLRLYLLGLENPMI